MNDRELCLRKANEMVNGHRQEDYGTPEDNFGIIAALWSTYTGHELSSIDVAMMMALLKIARIKSGYKADSFIDLAGYTACAYEIANTKDQPHTTTLDCTSIDPKLMRATMCEYADPSTLREWLEEYGNEAE